MWTEARTETLKRLWAGGISASQIAARLGGITRNAVIGKVHRLGLAGGTTTSRMRSPRRDDCIGHAPVRAARPARIKRMAARAAAGAIQYELPLPICGLEALAAGACALASVPAPVEELNIPPVLRIDLLDLKECMCRWPIGDPRSRDFHFCGRKRAAGGSYCAHRCAARRQEMTKRPSTISTVELALAKALVQLAVAAQAARLSNDQQMAEKIGDAGTVLEAVRREAAANSDYRRALN